MVCGTLLRARFGALLACGLWAALVGFSSQTALAVPEFRGPEFARKPPAKAAAKTGEETGKSKVKKYEEVITTNAVTRSGLFKVHQIDDSLFFELPSEALDADLLWVTQISETTEGSSFAGMPVGDRVVRWEKQGDRVFLRDVRFGIRADATNLIARAVKRSNLAPIVRAFDVKAYSTNKAPVIDVTDLFKKDTPEFSARRALSAGAIDESRSFLGEFKAFPRNVNIRVTVSFAPGKGAGGGEDGPATSGITAVVCHSIVRLPEVLMKPRRFDSRVGFFTESFTDYSDRDNHAAENVEYILRWRLEKKDPSAAVSEPVKPIVWYVAPEVPEKWRAFVKMGIEDWAPAFLEAGFTNAIQAKYAPDPKEDPDWDAEDARISSVRWLPSDIENAFGPEVHDPRTGEILSAQVRMFHNVEKLVRDWYFVQASPNDIGAQKLPLADDLEGRLIRFVVAHEVGHSLGFPHNMKASSSYTIQQLRDPEWTRKNGTAPSIMDYARFNYVAQPGDGAALTPGVGPYDRFAANWGYREFAPGDDEKAALEKIVKVQVDQPIYRFGGPNPAVDSTQQTEDLGSDAVEATRLGLLNLERVAGYLVTATAKPGKDYTLLENEFGVLFGQWVTEMGHVAAVVGGVQEVNLYYGDADRRYSPNGAEYQRRAAIFLIENAFRTPTRLLSRDIIARLTAEGVADRVLQAQGAVLRRLVSPGRIARMAEIEQTATGPAYPPARLFADLRAGLFEEIVGKPADIDLYRRNLQRTYVDLLSAQLKNPAANSDLPAFSRGELEAILELLKKCDPSALKPAVQFHLRDLAARIERALDPHSH